jgi:hypothetical protein
MSLEERMANLELQLGRIKRRNRWLLGTVLFVTGALAVPSAFEATALRARAQKAGTANEIRANNIILEDENGITQILLHAGKDGPALFMADENDMPRIAMRLSKNGPDLSLLNEAAQPIAVLNLTQKGPGLSLYDENGSPIAKLAALNGEPMLSLGGKTGQPRAWLRVSEDGPVLVMHDEKGNPRAGLSVGEDGPRLLLSDVNGKFRFWAGTASLVSSDGKRIEYPESSLILFGPNGKTIWSAIK